MIKELIKILPFAVVKDKDVEFAQGSNEYPRTFNELIKRYKWQSRKS